MQRVPLNFDWTFAETAGRFFTPPSDQETIDLPHDYIINKTRTPDSPGGASTGFFPSGQGTYTKQLDIPGDWQDKTVLLNIDGAYMHSEVSLNVDKLYHHPYGYTAYQVDLTPHLRWSMPNTLQISTQCFLPSTRWYSGGGLYREVSLLIGGQRYIHPWDVFVTTPQVSEDEATVEAAIEITNTRPASADASLHVSVLDPTGRTVAETSCAVRLQPSKSTKSAVELSVATPQLWDLDNPHLYTLHAVLSVGDSELDRSETAFGIRDIAIDAQDGFRLNGRPLKLRGGCIHHDNSLLGACAFPRAEERKIQLLKESGYNAIRSAHNPPSSALLDACDRIGMLVLDETFDMWRTQKRPLDYHLFFEEWWQRDTRAMVLRDRNHPCVYGWSIGNEIPELLGVSNGAYWTQVQADFIRSLDPTRPVTAAANRFTAPVAGQTPIRPDVKKSLQGEHDLGLAQDGKDPWGAQTRAAWESLDIAGYNYLYQRYAMDKKKFPDRIIHGTETHPFFTYESWQATLENNHVIGDFIWTAFDNLGEAGAGRVINDLDEPMDGLVGPYPWLSCWQGDHDLSGDRRPQSYFRQVMWGLEPGVRLFTAHPSRTGQPFYGMGWHWEDIQPDWTFAAEYVGQPVKVQAYADCDAVEFILNGRSLGYAPIERFTAVMEMPYEPGVLSAKAWKDGEPAAHAELHTAGPAAAIRLTPDRSELTADGMDLAFITAELVDAEGIRVFYPPQEIAVQVEGAGTLAGLGSGNPKTKENYGTGRRMTFNGRVLICVRAGRSSGAIHVEAAAAGLPEAAAALRCS